MDSKFEVVIVCLGAWVLYMTLHLWFYSEPALLLTLLTLAGYAKAEGDKARDWVFPALWLPLATATLETMLL